MQQWNFHGLNFSLLCQSLLTYYNMTPEEKRVIKFIYLANLNFYFFFHKIIFVGNSEIIVVTFYS